MSDDEPNSAMERREECDLLRVAAELSLPAFAEISSNSEDEAYDSL